MKLNKIALISHEMTYTGAPNSLLNIAVLLRQHGHKINVFTLSDGIFIREFQKKRFRVTKIFPDILDYSIFAEYDLVIANTVFCLSVAVRIQQYAVTVLYIREAHNLTDIISNCGFGSECLCDVNNIICVSEYAEEFIKNNFLTNRLFVLHNFLNTSLLHFSSENKAFSDEVRFLVAGTIEERKGTKLAVEAVQLLPHKIRSEMRLYIAGRKPDWSQNYWKNIDFSADRVNYLGEIRSKSEMRRLYNSINCVIIPSLDEACSLVALEAAMFGKTLIVTENVGAKYIIKRNGLIVETDSSKALSDAMKFMIKNKGELGAMGENSYKMFSETSMPDRYYRDFINIVNMITKE